ncbi:hypothetical protein CIB48_g401 [Xylaria polymorpha]|nr:hypothetical protein CIB48_g401 [Xylaria polymorpha]
MLVERHTSPTNNLEASAIHAAASSVVTDAMQVQYTQWLVEDDWLAHWRDFDCGSAAYPAAFEVRKKDRKVAHRKSIGHAIFQLLQPVLRISGRGIVEAALDSRTAASLMMEDEHARRIHSCLPIPDKILHRGLVRVCLLLGAGLRHLFLTLHTRAVVHVRSVALQAQSPTTAEHQNKLQGMSVLPQFEHRDTGSFNDVLDDPEVGTELGERRRQHWLVDDRHGISGPADHGDAFFGCGDSCHGVTNNVSFLDYR